MDHITVIQMVTVLILLEAIHAHAVLVTPGTDSPAIVLTAVDCQLQTMEVYPDRRHLVAALSHSRVQAVTLFLVLLAGHVKPMVFGAAQMRYAMVCYCFLILC